MVVKLFNGLILKINYFKNIDFWNQSKFFVSFIMNFILNFKNFKIFTSNLENKKKNLCNWKIS